MNNGKQRLQEFEALRALAILLLLALHSEVFAFKVFGYELGPAAVFVATFLLGSFFFLSGYFQEVSLANRNGNIFSFFKSKFIRIYPPYWAALVMYVLIMGFSLKRFDLYVYMLNLQFIFSPAFVKQLLTLWYISVVVAYYLIFGILTIRIKSNLVLLIWSAVIFGAAYELHSITGFLDARFLQYYFIFLAGIYFSRFQQVRETLFNLGFMYKAGVAFLGVLLFWLAQAAVYKVENGFYIMAGNFYILGWILMWLGIFRTNVGSWRVWSLISTASFFTYLYHRPFWKILLSIFDPTGWRDETLFKFLPGSIIVLFFCYILQVGYDRLLAVFRQKK